MKNKKSHAKTVGLKSGFRVGEKVILTSFDKGNRAIIEAEIENDDIVSFPKPDDQAFEVRFFGITRFCSFQLPE